MVAVLWLRSRQGRSSHWSVLNTVNRLRNGIVWASSRSRGRAASRCPGRNVGIDDRRAALALADIAAERQSLAKGEPALARKAAFDDGAPEDEHIHAGVRSSRRGVLRQGQRRFRRCGPPGLDPGKPAGLQLGDDLAGDFVVEPRPAGPDGRRSFLDIADLRDGRRSLSPALTRHGKPGPHSDSRGRCGVSPQKGVCRRRRRRPGGRLSPQWLIGSKPPMTSVLAGLRLPISRKPGNSDKDFIGRGVTLLDPFEALPRSRTWPSYALPMTRNFIARVSSRYVSTPASKCRPSSVIDTRDRPGCTMRTSYSYR